MHTHLSLPKILHFHIFGRLVLNSIENIMMLLYILLVFSWLVLFNNIYKLLSGYLPFMVFEPIKTFSLKSLNVGANNIDESSVSI